MKDAVDEPEPGAAMDVGLKLTVTPLGAPLAVRATAELNPPETEVVMVELPLLPAATLSDVGDAAMANAGVGLVPPLSAPINPVLGLPQPVTRS